MQKHQLTKRTKQQTKKRVARGGTRGKTSGRGHKGQRARAGTRVRPEMRDVIKKLPKLRGRGVNSNKSIKAKAQSVNLATLSDHFEDKHVVSPKSLYTKKLVKKVSGKLPVVKILGNGDLVFLHGLFFISLFVFLVFLFFFWFWSKFWSF